MACLGGCADGSNGPCQIDRAQLFGPQIIIRHIAESPKGPESLLHLNAPARFLNHLSMQRGDGLLSGVYPPAGQLKLGQRVLLKGGQNLIAIQQQGINPGPPPIFLPCPHRFAKSTYHPLGPELVAPI